LSFIVTPVLCTTKRSNNRATAAANQVKEPCGGYNFSSGEEPTAGWRARVLARGQHIDTVLENTESHTPAQLARHDTAAAGRIL
jgi:hypothetical protein